MISDTIAAIATPPGAGGIGILRVSGPLSLGIVGRHFTSAENSPLEGASPRTLVRGWWKEVPQGAAVDHLLAVRFQAPHSYTGEDLVEIHAHGGAYHLQSLLKDLLESGARLALPGEFTQRAFLNGKIDLTQAEAVADLISAGTQLSRRAAALQLAGGLRKQVETWRKDLVEISAAVEASLDFPEEQDQFPNPNFVLEKIRQLRGSIQGLLSRAKTGIRLRLGMRAVLCGRTNVGKSSLFNALIGQERAMVSEQKGTTRDYLEESYQVDGFPVVLADTAGLGGGGASLGREAERRSREMVEKADLVLLVLDASRPLKEEDRGLLAEMEKSRAIDWLAVLNKSDLPGAWKRSEAPMLTDENSQAVSAKSGYGLDQLNKKILKAALQDGGLEKAEEALVTRARHENALRKAEAGLERMESTLAVKKLGAEFLSGDLRESLDALGEITGRVSRQEVLDEIFSKFCIGK